MTTAPPRHRLVRLTPRELGVRLTESLEVYVAAMGYPRSAVRQRAPLWRDHAGRAGWSFVAALDEREVMAGLAYGYTGARGQWWHEEVRRGLRARTGPPGGSAPGHRAGLAPDVRPGDAGPGPSWLDDYVELTELHVLPSAQGSGLGEHLLRALLAGRAERRVLLSTPELDPARPARAWRLYRRLGFVDVLRHHRFIGDPRPFAVLGRPLPLPPPGAGPAGVRSEWGA